MNAELKGNPLTEETLAETTDAVPTPTHRALTFTSPGSYGSCSAYNCASLPDRRFYLDADDLLMREGGEGLDELPGYGIDLRLRIKYGAPEPAPPPGEKVCDYRTMTPCQRGTFIDFYGNDWSAVPPISGFYDQILHAEEAEFMLREVPKPASVMLLLYVLKHYPEALEERNQTQRVKSLLRWLSLGEHPYVSHLIAVDKGPWMTAQDINVALSARYKQNRRLQARLAHYVCLRLHLDRRGPLPSDHECIPSEAFVIAFNEFYPNGVVLQRPSSELLITHKPWHPYTAKQVAKQGNRHALLAWDFLQFSEQFNPVLSLWEKWRASPTLHVAATMTDPALRQLRALPPVQLASALKMKLQAAAALFLSSDKLAPVLDRSSAAEFNLDITLDRFGLSFGEDEITVKFSFVILGLPLDACSTEPPIIGSAVAVFGADNHFAFEDIAIDYQLLLGK